MDFLFTPILRLLLSVVLYVQESIEDESGMLGVESNPGNFLNL